MRPARSITFYFCVAEQSSGRLDTERKNSSIVRGTLVIYRASPSRIISFPPVAVAFISAGRACVIFRRASIHRDFFYLAAPSLVEISPLTLVLVTLSPFRVSKLPTINHDDEPSSNLFTGFSNCETPTRYHRRLTVQTLLSAEAVRGRLSLDATHETTRLPWKRSSSH